MVSNAAGARFHTPMIAASNLVFDVDGLLRLYDSLKLVDHNLVVKGTGETRLDGAVSSTGNLIKNGTGSLRFAEANVANFTANSGTVELANLTASSPLPLVCSSNVSFDPSVTLIARFGDDNAAVRAPLQAGGNFNPASATLSLIVSYTAATNDVLVLATAGTAITTTFAGLPEGATLSSGGVNWQISYAANGGKRLTLTAQNSAPVPPTFTSVSKLGNGNIRLQGTGATNIPIVIEATTNFTDWSDVANRNVTGGSFQFDDTNAPALNSRHYRARIQ